MVVLNVDLIIGKTSIHLEWASVTMRNIFQGTYLHNLCDVQPKVCEAIPRGVKELVAVTSCFAWRDCTGVPSPNLHSFVMTHITSP